MTSEEKAEALLPCPFCGGEARTWPARQGLAAVGCAAGFHNCAVQPSVRTLASEAVTAWNTRPCPDSEDKAPCSECEAIGGAIGTVEFMDPPDGGDVSLSEQVRRMRGALVMARAARDHLPEDKAAVERDRLIMLIASFPAHNEDRGPENEVFADVIPLDGAVLGDCPKPIERLADAILALLRGERLAWRSETNASDGTTLAGPQGYRPLSPNPQEVG